MARIKICGITNRIDALEAASLGVDMLGFVFYKKSKRYIEPAAAADIINELPPSIMKVGVFVNEERGRVAGIAEEASLDTLQFHGDETPEYCGYFRPKYKVIKAFRLRSKADLKSVNDYAADYYLFDTYESDRAGGTGKKFDWGMLKDFKLPQTPVILSGGLDPDNVRLAIKTAAPFGVDVSSGVESAPGEKDAELLKKFVENVRKAK